MKKVFVVLVVLFIGILFAGCASQSPAPVATPTPTPVPTSVVTAVPTVMPTPVVTSNMTANMTANVTANMTANVTANVTAVPKVQMITFTKSLTITPIGTIYVPVGTTVSWCNKDPYKPHGIKSLTNVAGFNFGSVVIPYGKPYNVTFTQKGAYDYTTLFQPQVTLKIIVS